jgi:hypothetical protein
MIESLAAANQPVAATLTNFALARGILVAVL